MLTPEDCTSAPHAKGKKIAVIGSGITGLTVARNLQGVGEIQLYDKSTGVGGRMATRSKEGRYFDHGAQFFTVRTKQFKEFLKPFISSDKVARWEPKVLGFSEYGTSHKRYWFEEHYVGSPKMTSLCKQLAKGLNVNLSMTVEEVEPVGDKTHLHFAIAKTACIRLGHSRHASRTNFSTLPRLFWECS